MWKPGSDKPSTQQTTTSETTRPAATTPGSSEKRKTELSRGTKNMRFMQRGPALPTTSWNAEQVDAPMEVDTADGVDHNALPTSSSTTNEEENSLDGKATPADMYGIEGAIAIGRRSFGGFNGVVAENWFRQKQELFPKKKKSNNSQKEVQQIAERHFNQLKPDEKNVQGKNKKRKNGISNGSVKRTKTLEDILMIASP